MAPSPSTSVGRYTIGGQLASGGMATVHVGAVKGAAGFSRLVALKRMLPSFASDPDFTLMFVDEARLAARIRHPNVVPTLDVVSDGSELSIVMDYVPGVTLAQIARLLAPAGGRVPVPIALAIVRDVLLGLHAAHEATDDDGRPLGIIHRDVSPQNILVGTDGAARLLDFGIAKANVRLHETRAGDTLKGKLRYMAPEQLEGAPAERRTDVFAAAVVLWEALTGERLVDGQHEGEIVAKVLRATPRPPSTVAPGLAPEVDVLVLRALSRTPDERFSNARDMAAAISLLGPVATALEVGEWVEGVAAGALAERAELVRLFERGSLGEQRLSVAFDPTRTAIPATDPLPGVANPPAPRSRRRQVSKALGLVAVAILGAVIVLGARTRVPAPAPAGASSSSSLLLLLRHHLRRRGAVSKGEPRRGGAHASVRAAASPCRPRRDLASGHAVLPRARRASSAPGAPRSSLMRTGAFPRSRPARAAAFAFVMLLHPVLAHAQSTTDATTTAEPHRRALALKKTGDEHLDARRYAEALASYDASYELEPQPVLLYNRGRALQFLGRYPEALDAIDRFASEAPADLQARVPGLEVLRRDLRSRVGALLLVGAVPGARVLVDDRIVGIIPVTGPLRVRAGRVAVDVLADGYLPYHREVVVPGGESAELRIELVARDRAAVSSGSLASPSPPATARERSPALYTRWWFWTAAGVVVAGAALAVVLVTVEGAPRSGDYSPGTVRF